MSYAVYASESEAACLPEVWSPTMGLRVKEQDNGKFLIEQHWRSNHGNGEWRKLPLVMKDGSDGD